MKQRPSWEANWFSASQEIPRVLWNLKVHYHIHNCQPTVPILSPNDQVHAPIPHFLKIHLNIILLFMPGYSKWSLFLRFPHQKPVYTKCYMPRPSHSSGFKHPKNIGYVHKYNFIISFFLLTFKNRASYIYRKSVPLPSKCCILYIFSTNIITVYFKYVAHSPFFSSKCRLFHNATFFGSCINHILHTGCAKI